MSALDFIVGLVTRGVAFSVDGDRLCVRGLGSSVTVGERGLISALKSQIRALLVTELPPERASEACAVFTAAAGVALCRGCAHGLPAHYWRTPDCQFYVGEPLPNGACRRCGVPWLEHLQSLRKADA